jgi:hypothetical protein
MTSNPDLREIGFEIVEKPGVCIITPAGTRAYGCTEPFTCADCNRIIGEEEVMWLNFGEQPKPLWRHSRDCING